MARLVTTISSQRGGASGRAPKLECPLLIILNVMPLRGASGAGDGNGGRTLLAGRALSDNVQVITCFSYFAVIESHATIQQSAGSTPSLT